MFLITLGEALRGLLLFCYFDLSYTWIRKGGKNAAQTSVKEPDHDLRSFDLLDLRSEPYSEYGIRIQVLKLHYNFKIKYRRKIYINVLSFNFLDAKTVNYIRAPKFKQEAAGDGNVVHRKYIRISRILSNSSIESR